jgi:histidine triad (HIT) family protein
MKDCAFCKIAAGQIPTQKVYENKNFIAFLDTNPRGEGHTLIVPKKHFSSLIDLDKETSENYISTIKEVAKILMDKHKADGFNLVINNGKAAGQIIEHAHFHLLPRKEGDNKRGIFLG